MEEMRNGDCGKVLWHFTTPRACTKLLSLYPKLESSEENIPRYNCHCLQAVAALDSFIISLMPHCYNLQ